MRSAEYYNPLIAAPASASRSHPRRLTINTAGPAVDEPAGPVTESVSHRFVAMTEQALAET